MSQDNSIVATSEMAVLPKLVDFKGAICSLCSCTDSAFTKSCSCEVYAKDELDGAALHFQYALQFTPIGRLKHLLELALAFIVVHTFKRARSIIK